MLAVSRPSLPLAALATLAALALLPGPLRAQTGAGHQHHQHPPSVPAASSGDGAPAIAPTNSGAHSHSDANSHDHSHALGPAGSTYDLRWLDAMVQHHRGALLMSEQVFGAGSPGVGALAHTIWNDQAQEIKAMLQWRRAWYPEAPVHPVTLPAGADPDAITALKRLSPEQIAAMQMGASGVSASNRITWFLEGMIAHHGGALEMAHDALAKSRNPTIRRLAREIIVAQRREILVLRHMLRHDGLNKPEYNQFDRLFTP